MLEEEEIQDALLAQTSPAGSAWSLRERQFARLVQITNVE
jgi:hypothetical protein